MQLLCFPLGLPPQSCLDPLRPCLGGELCDGDGRDAAAADVDDWTTYNLNS